MGEPGVGYEKTYKCVNLHYKFLKETFVCAYLEASIENPDFSVFERVLNHFTIIFSSSTSSDRLGSSWQVINAVLTNL